MDPIGASVEGNDDGLFLIVVGDEDGKTKQGMKSEIRSDPSADDAEMVVETLEESDYDDVEHWSEVQIDDDSNDIDVPYLPDVSDETSEEELPDFEEHDIVIKPATKPRRAKLLPLSQQKSYVNELRQQDPLLKENKVLLTDTLSKIMANTKCPPPPPNFFTERNNKFECGICGLKKDTKMAVARHWQDRHGPRCFICYACGADFRSQTNLYKHEKRCDSADAYIVIKARTRIKKYKGACPGRPFHLPDGYDKKKISFISCLRTQNPEMVKNREGLVQILCDEMAKEIPPPKPPIGAVVTISDKMYQCDGCGLTGASVRALERHWRHAHGPRYLQCLACGVQYRDPRNLYKHEKRCTQPDACAVLQARAATLAQRRKTPRIEPRLEPQDIGEEKCYKCKLCPAVFKRGKSLRAHTLSHLGLRPYSCDSCPAKYTSASALSRHKLTHNDETYLCDQCELTFKSKPLLKSHLNSHLPLRKFACPQCEKRYAQKWALQVHIDREHHKLPARYACQMCPKRYPRTSLLKDHMLKKHGMTLITRKMLFRDLPNLSDSQLKQITIVKKSDTNLFYQPNQNISNNDLKPNTRETNEKQEISTIETVDDDVEVVEGNPTHITHCKKAELDYQNCTQTQNKEKPSELLKCTEKIQSGSELVQQEPSGTQVVEDNAETQIGEDQDNESEGLLKYAKQIRQEKTSNTKPVIVIKDGQAIFMNENKIDFYKRKLRNRKNNDVDLLKQSLVTEVANNIRHESDPEPESLMTNKILNPMLQEEEVISKTDQVVTVKNCISTTEQPICQSQKSKTKITRRERRKQNLFKKC